MISTVLGDEVIQTGETDQLDNGPLGVAAVTHTVTGSGSTSLYTERDPSGQLIGLRTSGTGGGAHYYVEAEQLGTILRVVDATGASIDAYTFDPFGRRTVNANGLPQPFGYTGAYADSGNPRDRAVT